MFNLAIEWQRTAKHLLKSKLDAVGACRLSDACIPGAELEHRLQAIERCYGLELPGSYRDFMLEHDGWEAVFRDASLASTTELLDPSWGYRAQRALRAKNAMPIDDSGDCVLTRPARLDGLLPIGMNASASVMFLIDGVGMPVGNEHEVVVWIADLGMRVPSFAELLRLLADLGQPQHRSAIRPAAMVA